MQTPTSLELNDFNYLVRTSLWILQNSMDLESAEPKSLEFKDFNGFVSAEARVFGFLRF